MAYLVILNFKVDMVMLIFYGNDSMFIGSIERQLLLQIALWPETMIRELCNFPNLCCPCHCKITNGWCETDTHSNHRHRSSKICSFFDKKLQSFAFASFVLTKFFFFFFDRSIHFSLLVVMSEDMVKDGYEDIMNIDISSVAIEMMRRKYEYIPQLKCILLKELH